jgi:hypothetical protein
MLDETIITETPPLYCCYGHIGEQVRIPISGGHARRICRSKGGSRHLHRNFGNDPNVLPGRFVVANLRKPEGRGKARMAYLWSILFAGKWRFV